MPETFFCFSSIVTFKIYLLSLLLRSHWSFFPSLSSRVHWFTVFSPQMGGKLAEWNRAAPICTSERFGLAELKQRRACQLSSPSPWHSGIVLHNAFASSFSSLILNGLSCLHFPCEISPPSSRAHHYEILSNLGGFSFYFFFFLLSAGSYVLLDNCALMSAVLSQPLVAVVSPSSHDLTLSLSPGFLAGAPSKLPSSDFISMPGLPGAWCFANLLSWL